METTLVVNRQNPKRSFWRCSRIAYSRTYDEFRRAQETAVVVTNVRHSAKARLYDSEDRVCGYALTNAAGRGVSVSLAYDGSYVTNTVYTMPNGSVFSAMLSREAGRMNLVTRRDYFFGGQSIYWYSTEYDLLNRPTNSTDSVSLAREWLYNRRSELAAYPLSPAVGSLAVENRYDHRHRRSRKIVKQYDGADWETKETHTFVWDGNNIVLERVEFANGASRTFEYFWGADKSGSEQGAGGVEGLLAVSMDGVFYILCYDHNANIILYVSETGSIAAQYTYDPYGNVIDTYGNLADVFSFGFSTQYHDRETGMVGYKRRFYRPDLGRWLNRDPIEEEGGENMYAFCGNNPVCEIDTNGCGTWSFGIPSPWGNKPDFTVSYELDEKERNCCKGVKVLRYVRKFITGGQIGPYSLDGNPDDFVEGSTIAYAPDDWPEGPGIGWWNTIYYRISWSWDFKYDAVCTRGNWAGKTLSTRTKLYWADGHKPGETDFDRGFSDPPKWWPDLIAPTTMQ